MNPSFISVELIPFLNKIKSCYFIIEISFMNKSALQGKEGCQNIEFYIF